MKLKLFVASVGGLLALAVGAARASDPVGVYALLDNVVIALPKDSNAPSAGTVQLWGAFSFAVKRQPNGSIAKPAGGFGNAAVGDVYGPVQTGYLYYTCAGVWQTCANEWNDLKAVAGKGKVVGFAGRYTSNGRIRLAAEAIANPDPYPVHMGVTPIGTLPSVYGGQITNRTQYPDLVAALGSALARK
jgi:hypothetical protein